jgi:phenylacetate-CoA ligase
MRKFTSLEQLFLAKEYTFNYGRISKFLYLSHDQISEHQFRKIKALVNLAYHHTKFYQHLYTGHDIHPEDVRTWSDFEKLPPVTKSDIIVNHSDCIVDKKTSKRNLRVARSSGSSGQVLDIVTDSSFWIQTALMMLRMFQGSFHIDPCTRGALIYTSEYPFQSPTGLYKAYHLPTLTSVKDLISALNRLRPDFVTSYPSILMELIADFPEECSRLRPRAIATNSEHSTEQQRNTISAVFNSPVFDEYSTEEMSLGGFQCPNKNYHLQEDCAYFEILDPVAARPVPEGQAGEIVGTCLINQVMPFIRYRQGDLGSIAESQCLCGNNGRILTDISGRRNSSFKLSNGRIIPSGKILDWVYRLILDHKVPVAQFQIIQKTLDDVEIAIVARSNCAAAWNEQVLRNSFYENFGEFLSIQIKQVSEIPRTPAGKHIPIKSLID